MERDAVKMYQVFLEFNCVEDLEWIAEQCEKKEEQSPVFMSTVGGACREEIKLRSDGKHAFGLSVQNCTNLQDTRMLRNLMGAITDVLYKQLDQGIGAALEERVGPQDQGAVH